MRSLAEVKAELQQRLGRAFADAGANTVSVEVENLVQEIEALNPTPWPVGQLPMLDGYWQLLYSNFGLERETTLRRISFGTLPREAKIRVTGIFQAVDAATGRYDNHVVFTTLDGAPGIHVTHGVYRPHADSDKRLSIAFTNNAVSARDGVPIGELRKRLGLDPDEPMAATVSFEGWSDVTYLDDDTRIMRGNAGNLYVLARIAATAPGGPN